MVGFQKIRTNHTWARPWEMAQSIPRCPAAGPSCCQALLPWRTLEMTATPPPPAHTALLPPPENGGDFPS